MLLGDHDRLQTSIAALTERLDEQTVRAAFAEGAALGFDDRQVKADAKRFKEFIESRGTETGAWRGDVPRPDQQ